MNSRSLVFFIFFLAALHANAQIGAMKLVGNNTKDYGLGIGAFIKSAFPASDAADITVELGAGIFVLKDYGSRYGTIMCPLKAGYRYSLNGTGEGLYIEPQAGFNLFGATSLPGDNGEDIDVKYHGLVLAAGVGYLFTIGSTPFDLNFRYETTIAHGGSNNLIAVGISRSLSFGKRDNYY